MNKIFTLIFSLAMCSTVSFGQAIDSLRIIPYPAAPTDDLKLIAITSYPGGPCSYVSSYPNTQNGNTITMQPIYCFESGSGGCSRTDTLAVGQLSAGNYTISFEMLSTTNPGPCGSQGYLLKAIKQLNFTVGGTTGIQTNQAETVNFFPNPVKDVITFSLTGEQDDAEIKIFNATGVVVKALTPGGSINKEIDVSNLSTGIYFYTIRTKEQLLSGKLVIAN